MVTPPPLSPPPPRPHLRGLIAWASRPVLRGASNRPPAQYEYRGETRRQTPSNQARGGEKVLQMAQKGGVVKMWAHPFAGIRRSAGTAVQPTCVRAMSLAVMKLAAVLAVAAITTYARIRHLAYARSSGRAYTKALASWPPSNPAWAALRWAKLSRLGVMTANGLRRQKVTKSSRSGSATTAMDGTEGMKEYGCTIVRHMIMRIPRLAAALVIALLCITAQAAGHNAGGIAVATHSSPPTITPNGGTFTEPVTVTLAEKPFNGGIAYTLDGSDPTQSGVNYSSPFTLTKSTTVRAAKWIWVYDPVTGENVEDFGTEATANFTINIPQVAAPTISPNGGTFTEPKPVLVSLTTATQGAEIRYTLGVSEPTSASTLYTGPFKVSRDTRLSARAFKAGMSDSEITSTFFYMPPVVMDPYGGTFIEPVTVRLTKSNTNTYFAYTLDGSDPVRSDQRGAWGYSIDIPIEKTSTLRAVYIREEWDPETEDTVITYVSPEIRANFTIIQAATPTLTPNGGTFVGAVPVEMATLTEGAEIRYTIDGSEPTSASQLYTGLFMLEKSATIKARAFKVGMYRTEVASATYSIDASYVPAELNFANRRGENPADIMASSYSALGFGDRVPKDISAGSGSGNFRIDVPVLSLPGRGRVINLGLHYNSRIWQRVVSDDDEHNPNPMAFNWYRDSVSPGWTIGYGKIRWDARNSKAFLFDGDGTGHPIETTRYEAISDTPNRAKVWARTTDGTFIDMVTVTDGNWYSLGKKAEVTYPDGTVVLYERTTSDSSYPTRIVDPNGNVTDITYRQCHIESELCIETITDSVERVVRFHYDAGGLLTAIDAPGLNGSPRTLVRLQYRLLPLSHDYENTDYTTPVSAHVIKAIYFPGTATGYWFGDADSYSSYGMIRKVSERRGMSFSSPSLTDQGTITEGVPTRVRVYNYPLTKQAGLPGAPTYTELLERWEGKDDKPIQDATWARTTYEVKHTVVGEILRLTVVTVTYPNGTIITQRSNLAGLPYDKITTYPNPDGTTQKTRREVYSWEIGDYKARRLVHTQFTDELGQTTATKYTYAPPPSVAGAPPVYNQIVEAREYDYGGTTVRRRTKIAYEEAAGFLDLHIIRLPKVIEVYDRASAVPTSRIEYSYDGQPLIDAPGIERNINAFGARTVRGNVTSVKTYADAANREGAVVEERRYDIAGNLRTITRGCCEQEGFKYDLTSKYAYPVEHSWGAADPASPTRMTSSTTYDLNTGLVLSSKDANGRVTSQEYDPTTLLPTITRLPTGATVRNNYDVAKLMVTTSTYTSSGTQLSSNITWTNGLWLQRRMATLAEGGWDVVDTRYDELARVSSVSRPVRRTLTPDTWSWTDPRLWTSYKYDSLGRVSEVLSPDGSRQSTVHNEPAGSRPAGASADPGQTQRAVDAWGRQSWTRTDALGLLVEVVEPPAGGNGSFGTSGNEVTRYKYDVSGNLVEVAQGAQLRLFRYDSLGRPTHQYLPEKSRTLSDTGAYSATGGKWSDVFTYDARSNMISTTDARGVKTFFDYMNDPLNRLQAMRYVIPREVDPSSPISESPNVTFKYMTAGDLTRPHQVTTAGVGTETYGYDVEGRLGSIALTLNSRSAYPQITNYTYDSLSRVATVQLPAEYWRQGSPRRVLRYALDPAGRTTSLTVNGVSYASGVVYNAAGQPTSIKIGPVGTQQVTETYAYGATHGLLTRQRVLRAGTALLDLSYDYLRKGTTAGRTGQVTRISDTLQPVNGQSYSYDALGRLTRVTGGALTQPQWSQDYRYDRFGNRKNVTVQLHQTGAAIPMDGSGPLSYNGATNRISTAGYAYDAAGNLTRGKGKDGLWQRYRYDEAGRLVKVLNDSGVAIESYTYGRDRYRILTVRGNTRTYYILNGGEVVGDLSETQTSTGTRRVGRSYTYFAGRALATVTATGSVFPLSVKPAQFHHPDQLGTQLITSPSSTSAVRQDTLPFGTALEPKPPTLPANDRLFTTYERSAGTGLDYAINRFYDPRHGRFTQVDPLGMGAVRLRDPQSLNLYSYVMNDPVNLTDPLGLMAQAEDGSCVVVYNLDDGYNVGADATGCGGGGESSATASSTVNEVGGPSPLAQVGSSPGGYGVGAGSSESKSPRLHVRGGSSWRQGTSSTYTDYIEGSEWRSIANHQSDSEKEVKRQTRLCGYAAIAFCTIAGVTLAFYTAGASLIVAEGVCAGASLALCNSTEDKTKELLDEERACLQRTGNMEACKRIYRNRPVFSSIPEPAGKDRRR